MFSYAAVFMCFPEVLISHKYFLYSYDDKTACEKILDKRGLKGYQVIQVTHASSFDLTCYLAVSFNHPHLPE